MKPRIPGWAFFPWPCFPLRRSDETCSATPSAESPSTAIDRTIRQDQERDRPARQRGGEVTPIQLAASRMGDDLARARWFADRGCSVIPIDHPSDPAAHTDPSNVGKTPTVAWKGFQAVRPTDAQLMAFF